MDPFRIKIIQPLSKTYSSSTHYKILLLLTQIHAEKNHLLTFGRNSLFSLQSLMKLVMFPFIGSLAMMQWERPLCVPIV